MDSKEIMGMAVNTLKRALPSLPELPKSSKCLRCETEFYLKNGEVGHDIYGRIYIYKKHCAKCALIVEAEKKEKHEKELADARIRRINNVPHMVDYLLPARFAELANKLELPDSFRKYVPPCERGLCLTGSTGVGKTTTMALILKEQLLSFAKLEAHDKNTWDDLSVPKRWAFISYPKFIMQLQDAYRRDGEETPYAMLKEMAEMRYLIIDDLGAEKPTEFVRQATYFLINEREMEMRPTFITTNFSMDHLNSNIDPRIASRIAGMCEVIELKGKDRRISKPLEVVK
jgi:DNA replication protein DnaC